MSKLWIDKYDVIWERLKGGYVWNSHRGRGLWDSGKGLKPYYATSENLERN